jgi:[acyl-carrier-protein] S-malonyltransferase
VRWKSRPLAPVVLGHSLGEYSALVAAGALALEDGLTLVHARGRFMQEAVAPGKGAMAALLGIDAGAVGEACRLAAAETGGVVSPANLNAPEQTVIAGEAARWSAPRRSPSSPGRSARWRCRCPHPSTAP